MVIDKGWQLTSDEILKALLVLCALGPLVFLFEKQKILELRCKSILTP